MKKGIFPVIMLALLALLMAAPVMAQSSNWDYVRGNLPTGSKISDSLICLGQAYDSTCVFYFNDLIPYGSIWVKMTQKASHESDSLAMPRLEYSLISDAKLVGKYHYKIDDTTSTAKWDTSGSLATGKDRWTRLKAQSYLQIAAADTITRIITYDLRKYGPIGVRIRAACDSTKDSTLIKSIFMTGTKNTPGKTQLNY